MEKRKKEATKKRKYGKEKKERRRKDGKEISLILFLFSKLSMLPAFHICCNNVMTMKHISASFLMLFK